MLVYAVSNLLDPDSDFPQGQRACFHGDGTSEGQLVLPCFQSACQSEKTNYLFQDDCPENGDVGSIINLIWGKNHFMFSFCLISF